MERIVKNSRIELAKHVFEGSRFMERRNIQVKRVASLGHGGLLVNDQSSEEVSFHGILDEFHKI